MGLWYSVSGLGISTSRRCSWEEGRVSYTFLIGPNKKQKPLLGFGSGLWAELSGRGALAMPEGIEPDGARCLLRGPRSRAQGNAASAGARASPRVRAWPRCRCPTLRVRVPAWPSLSFVPPFACGFCGSAWRAHCGFAGERGMRAGSAVFLRSQLYVFAFGGLASFVSSLLWRCLCLFFPVSSQVTPCSFASFLFNKFLRVLGGGKFPFPPYHKSFLQNNNTLT